MDANQLATAITAALPFASTDRTRPHLNCLAISSSRIRATNGHVLIHIWDKSVGDFDASPVVTVNLTDVRMILAAIRAAKVAPPCIVRRRRKAPVLLPDATLTKGAFTFGERTFPLVVVDESFPPSDRVQIAKARDKKTTPAISPAYAALAYKAATAIAGKDRGAFMDVGGELDQVSIYTEGETLCTLVTVMPVRSDDTFAKAMERRAAQLPPPPAPVEPKTEVEILREKVAALEAQIGKAA